METPVKLRVIKDIKTEAEWLVTDPILFKGEAIQVIVGASVKFKIVQVEGKKFSEVAYSTLTPEDITEMILDKTVAFNPASIPSGGTLPATSTTEFMFVGVGTFNKPGGGTIVTTQPLNVLSSNGTVWSLNTAISIPLTDYATKINLNFPFVGKEKNLLPNYAIGDDSYLGSVYINYDNVYYTDDVLKFLGIRGASISQAAIRTKAPIATVSGKYITVAFLVVKTAGTFKANNLAIYTTALSTFTSPVLISSTLSSIDLDANHKIYYAQGLAGAGLDGKYIWLRDNNYAGSSDLWCAPTIAVTDTLPSILNIDLFPKTEEVVILDQIKARSLGDYIQPVATGFSTTVISTDPYITDIVAYGGAVSLRPDAALNSTASFKFLFGAGKKNKFATVGLYVYDPSGNFTQIPGISFLYYNGVSSSYFATARSKVTHINSKVRLYQATDEFITVESNYGVDVRVTNTHGSSQQYYAFGFMAAVTDTAVDSLNLKPVSWTPKYDFVKGYLEQAGATPLLSGKKILWMGTSIPAGGGYPEIVSAQLGANLTKVAIGGGSIRAFNEDGSWFAQNQLTYKFSLKASDITTKYGGNLGLKVSASNYATLDGAGVTLTQPMLDALTVYNYENLLVPNLDADIFVFDYGINDRNGQTTFPFQTAEVSGVDRKYFAGANSFIFKVIDDAKKIQNKAYQCIFITHHSRNTASPNATYVVDSQINIAKFYGGKLVNIADNIGVSDINLAFYIADYLHPLPGTDIASRISRYIVSQMKEI